MGFVDYWKKKLTGTKNNQDINRNMGTIGEELSDEVILLVLAFLTDPKDLYRLKLTCRYFNFLCNYPTIRSVFGAQKKESTWGKVKNFFSTALDKLQNKPELKDERKESIQPPIVTPNTNSVSQNLKSEQRDIVGGKTITVFFKPGPNKCKEDLKIKNFHHNNDPDGSAGFAVAVPN